MPAESRYGVFEIGMNHPGEIVPLTAMVRPDIALITTVEPVHIEHFASLSAIADAKGEIFSGLSTGGTAIINRDNPNYRGCSPMRMPRRRGGSLRSVSMRRRMSAPFASSCGPISRWWTRW